MKRGHLPTRTCIGCRRRRPKSEMIRFKVCPDGLTASEQGGRGLYLCPDLACFSKALRRKEFRGLLGGHSAEQGVGYFRRLLSENALDGTYSNYVMCRRCTGGGAVG